MRVNCRCTDRDNCGRRKTLARNPETDYIRIPKCPGCGKQTLRVDPSVRRQTLKRTCYCRGVAGENGPWPHRIGTVIDEHNFCHSLTLDQVGEILTERGILSREELEILNEKT